MSRPCSRNCYGIDLSEVNQNIKANLPMELLNFILGLLDCANFNSLKNMLANWDAGQLYGVKYLIDKVTDRDRNNQRYENDYSTNFPDKDMWDIINGFNNTICNGNGGELVDIINEYNKDKNDGNYNGITFPPGLTDKDKDIIRDIIGGNNSNNDNKYNPDGDNDLVVIDKNRPNIFPGDNNGGDIGDIFDNTGNPIINIPDDVINNITLDRKSFKCFEPKFDLDNYIFSNDNVMLTPTKISNIRKLHNTILLPIYNFYYGVTANPSCQMKVVFALGGTEKTFDTASGSMFSRHLRGEAVDFTMVGVDYERLSKDLKDGNLVINFGVMSPTNGIHMTLPLSYNGFEITNTIIESPAKSDNSLKINFL